MKERKENEEKPKTGGGGEEGKYLQIIHLMKELYRELFYL
jgi:hypothetical protein